MALRNNFYIPLIVNDVLTDEKLMECSEASHGVYLRLICLLHKQKEYGCIVLTPKECVDENMILNFCHKLARQMPFKVENIKDALIELNEFDVIQIESNRLSQKRMVKDNALSETRSKSGKKGMNNRYNNDKGFTPPENSAKEIKTKEFDPIVWEQKYNEFSKMTSWLESLCMQIKVEMSDLLSKLKDFLIDQNNKEMLDNRDEKEIKRHFVSWLKLQTKESQKDIVKSTIKIKK